MSDADPALYVSIVKGHLVQRYGTGILIGATRDPRDPSQVTWDEDEVVKLSEHEQAAYRREYARALRDGALKQRRPADFDAANAKRNERTVADVARAKTEADAAATKAKAEAAKQQKTEKE